MTVLQEDPTAPINKTEQEEDAPAVLGIPKDDEVVVDAADETEESEAEDESDDEDDSDEEEDPGTNTAVDEGIDMDDDFALLAMAKRRLADQQKKQDKLEAEQAAVEEDSEEEEDDDDNDQVEPVTNEDDNGTIQENDFVVKDGQDEQVEEVPATTKTLAVSIPEPPEPTDDPSPIRRERDENAELWALLRQSQSRVAETKDLVIDDDDDSDEEEDGEAPSAGDDSPKATVAFGHVEPASAVTTDEDEESKRNFKQENAELWELLAKSKSRLEEAALQKMKDAEKAAAADEAAPPTKREENPYKDLQSLPDEVPDESDEAALTQKELLLAMAVAEEAARSGKEIFATPSKEELRTRDIDSFEFLKKKEILPAIPETPIGNNAKEEERERSRLAFLSQKLSQRWTSFRQRVNEIDQSR